MKQDWVCLRVIKKQIQSLYTVSVVVEFLSFTRAPWLFLTECVTCISDTTKLGEEVTMWGNSVINGEAAKTRNPSLMQVAPKEMQNRTNKKALLKMWDLSQFFICGPGFLR